MITTKKIKYSIISLISLSLIACFGKGVPNANISTTYGILQEYTQPIVYNSKQLQASFVESQLNGGFNEASNGAKANIINLESQFSYTESILSQTTPQTNIIAYAIKYNTPGINPNTRALDVSRNVSGLVILPESGTTIKGVVLYFHPTETAKNQVPSCLPESNLVDYSMTNFSYCQQYKKLNDNFQVHDITNLGAVFAASGYIVVAPDYVGMGNDYSIMHPYVFYPENNALSGIYMLGATKALLQKIAYPANFKNSNLFITGFSEGGAYALNASQQLQYNQSNYLKKLGLNLSVTAPGEGAYDLNQQMNYGFADQQDGVFNGGSESQADLVTCSATDARIAKDVITACNPSQTALQINTWNAGDSIIAALGKPVVLSYVLTAFGYYSLGNLNMSYNLIMRPEFWQNILYTPTLTRYNTQQLYTIPTILATNALDIAIHASSMVNPSNNQKYSTSMTTKEKFYVSQQVADIVKSDDFVDLPESFVIDIPAIPLTGNGINNSANALAPEKLTTLPAFLKIVSTGNTYNWTTSKPIHFVTMAYDSVVPVANVRAAYPVMSALAPNLVESTTLQTFQTSNNLNQYLVPLNYKTGAITQYWSPINSTLLSAIAIGVCRKETDPLVKKTCEDKINNLADQLGMSIDHVKAGPFIMLGAFNAFEQANSSNIKLNN